MSRHRSNEDRDAIMLRDLWRCVRCGQRATDWHHRRTRAVHDEHTNCACNGIALCHECHMWAHAHPEQARQAGLIVSRYHQTPATVPVTTIDGTRLQDCTYNTKRTTHVQQP